MLARLGRTVDADQAAEAVLASALPQQYKASFTFSIARAFDQGHADANALNWYNRVKITPGGDVATALAKTGAIKRRLGDATWVQDYLEAITNYPASAVAAGLLDELDAAPVPVVDYVRGLVDYRAFRNDAARTALMRAIAQQSHAAEATCEKKTARCVKVPVGPRRAGRGHCEAPVMPQTTRRTSAKNLRMPTTARRAIPAAALERQLRRHSKGRPPRHGRCHGPRPKRGVYQRVPCESTSLVPTMRAT